MESNHTQRSSLNILLSTFRLPSFITTERWMCSCIQQRYLDSYLYLLFVFTDDREDDEEHKTDGDCHEQNEECRHEARTTLLH